MRATAARRSRESEKKSLAQLFNRTNMFFKRQQQPGCHLEDMVCKGKQF